MGYFVVWTAVTRPFICGCAMSRASLREVYTAMIIHRIIVVDLGLGIWFTLTIVNIFLHFAFIFVVVFFSYVFVEWVVSLKRRRAFVDTASNWEIYFVAVNRIIVVHQDTERYALIICLHHPRGAGQTRGNLTFWKFLCQIFYPGA